MLQKNIKNSFFAKVRKSNWPDYINIEIENKIIKVQIRPRAANKYYRLSIGAGAKPILSVPQFSNIKGAKQFLAKQKIWLSARLKEHPKPIPFIDGEIIPLRGIEHKIIGVNNLRGIIKIIIKDNKPALLVPGGKDFMAKRLENWLKKQAKIDIARQVKIHCNNLNVTAKSISIRSQSSRWGSCSSSGRLNFNWRLIMAPVFVLDYVAAHEVAHLLEMNHSKAFWDNVKKTLPNMQKGKIWLKENGQKLMAYNI